MSLFVNGKFRFSIGNASDCLSEGKSRYWLPVRQGQLREGQHLWIDDRLKNKGSVIQTLKWDQSEPNGFEFEKCVVATTDGVNDNWNDQTCNSFRCSICFMPRVQTFYLRGYAFELDHEYILSMDTQYHSSRITFEGQKLSYIYWHVLQEKTEVRHFYNDTYKREFSQMPFGRLKSTLSKFTNVRKYFSGYFFAVLVIMMQN